MTEAGAWRVLARGIVFAYSVIFVVFLVRELRAVVLLLLFAVILAAAATPLVDKMTAANQASGARVRLSRGVAAIFVFLTAVLTLILVAALVVGAVAPDLQRLATNSPQYVAQAQTAFNELLSRYPQLAQQLQGGATTLQLQDVLTGAVGIAAQAPQILRVAGGAFGGFFHALFALILALYLTADGARIRRYIVQLFPFDRQEQLERIGDRVGERLGAWARGEALLGGIVGGLTWIAALVLGLPYAGAIALIAGVGELVPNLGPFIAAIPLILIGFLTSPTQGFLALGVAVLIQQLENNLIVPRVMGQAVELHPLVVMVAILAGNELLGIMGALLAVPVAASLAVVIDEIQQERLARHQFEQAVITAQESGTSET
jgi:predicted PurR-regulated permease PerM